MSTASKLCLLLIGMTVLTGISISCSTKDAWIKPARSVRLSVDVHKALVVAASSSPMSGYGPLAGVLVEMLPRDLADLDAQLPPIDWSKEQCIWTFDCAIEEITVSNSTVTIRFAMEPNTGVRFWFFKGISLRGIKEIKFQ